MKKSLSIWPFVVILLLIIVFVQTVTPVVAQKEDRVELMIGETEKNLVIFRIGQKTIKGDQLGEFIAKNLSIKFGTDMRPLSVKLRLEMISQKEGIIGKYESRPVKVKPGKMYPASTWIQKSSEYQDFVSAPGFGERRKITFGRAVVINHEEQYFPRECEGATHALWIDVGQGDGLMVCLNIER